MEEEKKGQEKVTYTLSVFDIYGTDKPGIPVGFEVVDFRPPVESDEYYLDDRKWPGRKNFLVESFESYLWPDWDKTPVLILRKKAYKRRGA